MRRAGTWHELRQQPHQADAGPSDRADQIAAWRVGDARQRGELMERLVLAKLVERKRQGALHETANPQPPLGAVNSRRACVRVDAVVTIERRELRTCARQ